MEFKDLIEARRSVRKYVASGRRRMSAASAKEDALAWLRQLLGMSSALVLNVAGPRESKSPGMQAKAFLSEVLWEM